MSQRTNFRNSVGITHFPVGQGDFDLGPGISMLAFRVAETTNRPVMAFKSYSPLMPIGPRKV
jgi:hypothetical protein